MTATGNRESAVTVDDLLATIDRESIRPALDLLPRAQTSPAATAALLAIGLQESGLKWRRQFNDGPARGFYMFEPIGVEGVLRHPASSRLAEMICAEHGLPAESTQVWAALEHNDVLAACFARLLLWTHPRPLPPAIDEDQVREASWAYYLWLWRPGVPRPEKWAANWARACAYVDACRG